jgi:hypothetical protein
MNERIKRFSEQAINYATSNQPLPDLKDKDLFLNNLFERFAELIVQECAKVASVETSDNGVGEVIRKHFGVEE